MPASPKVRTKGHFFRSVVVLVSGTALAHLLTAAALPVLSRLYTPTDFGLLAVFSSVLSIIASAACLRYDIAVSIPEQDDDALHLLTLAVACAFIVSISIGIPALLAPQWIANQLGQPSLAANLWLLPIGILLASCYSALQFWQVRKSKFNLLARARVGQSASCASTQIALGWSASGSIGLLLGYVMNSGIACIALSGQFLRWLPSLSLFRLRSLAIEYRRFPQYSTLEALANSAGIQLPIIMIAALAAPAEAGQLMMATYAIQAPMALIGTAISQVYLSRAPQEYRSGNLGQFTNEILAGLLKTGVGPLAAVGIVSPAVFTIVLGPEWQRAGHLVAWMTPWFILQFLAVPISMALHVTNQQRTALLLQVWSIAIRIGTVIAAYRYAPLEISEYYAISGFVFYFSYLFIVLRTTSANLFDFLKRAKLALPHLLGWILAAYALNLFLSNLQNSAA